jgi:hypothetical protein
VVALAVRSAHPSRCFGLEGRPSAKRYSRFGSDAPLFKRLPYCTITKGSRVCTPVCQLRT